MEPHQSFEVIAPLLSRCRVFVLNELSEEEMKRIIARTKVKMSDESLFCQFLIL